MATAIPACSCAVSTPSQPPLSWGPSMGRDTSLQPGPARVLEGQLIAGASPVTQLVKNLPAGRETRGQSLGRKDPLEKEGQPTAVFLPGEPHGLRSLAATVHGVHTNTLTFTFSKASHVALVVKNLPASAGDTRDVRLIPGLGRPPGGGHGNSLQCSCLENPTD